MNQRKVGAMLSSIITISHSVISLIYVPLLLHFLTKAEYGIYQLIGSFIAYLTVLDFGLANTTVCFLSKAYTAKDDKRAKEIISISHTIYLGIAVILALVGIVFYFFLDPIYGKTLTPSEMTIAKQIYWIMLINVMVVLPAHVFTAVVNANEHFIFGRTLGLIKVIFRPVVVYAVLCVKASVLNLVLTQTIFSFLVIGVNYMYCKKRLHVSFPLNFKNIKLMKELTGFSVFIFLYVITEQIFWRLGQMILGAVSGATAVANYAIAMQLLFFTIWVPRSWSNVFLPKFSSSIAKNTDLKEVNNIFSELGRIQLMMVLLLLCGFAALGKTFLLLWVGPSFSVCYWIGILLMSGYALEISQASGILILQALNKHSFRAYLSLCIAVLYIVLAIPLAKSYGGMGCAYATVICLMVQSFCINCFYKKVGLDLKRFFKNWGQVVLTVIPVVILIKIFFWNFPLKDTWFSLFWHGLILTAIYGGCMWFLTLNNYEKQVILGPLKSINKFLVKRRVKGE